MPVVHHAHPFSVPSDASASCPRFEIHADRSPAALARIVDAFARLDLLPIDFRARRSCGGLWAALHVEIDAATAERIAERLRASVGITGVVLIHLAPRPRRATPTRTAASAERRRLPELIDA